MDERKKVLILTADAGFGHRSAANAVLAAMQERYGDRCETLVLNPLEDKRVPAFLRDSQTDYDRIVKSMPELYRLGYDASDSMVTSALVDTALTVMLYDVMRDLVKEHNPDAILTTYPMYQGPLVQVFMASRHRIPLYTSITDLSTVHRLWFNRHVEGCLVPNTQVFDLAESYDVPRHRIHITGIPVHPRVVNETREKPEIRAALGWDPNLPTVLAVGSRRVERLMDAVNVLNHFGRPLQLAVVAGKDEELYKNLRQIDWHVPAHLYEFADNIPEMMHASDCIISKAGGLIVTEALACGLPMALVDVLPGQEDGNAEYVISNGAGELASEPIQLLELFSHWFMDDCELMRERAKNARRIGKPNSAYEVADYLWFAAKRGPQVRKRRRLVSRAHMMERLINEFTGDPTDVDSPEPGEEAS